MTQDHRFRVLQQVLWKQVSLADAATMLGTKPRHVKQMLEVWNTRLNAMNLMIDKLQTPLNTKNEQAEIKKRLAVLMGVTPRQINRALNSANVRITPPKTVEKRTNVRETAQNRREMHYTHALDAIMGNTPVIDAAENAEVSTRQMYRIIDKLCKAVDVDYRDLRDATLEQRSRVAQLVAINQGLE